MAENNLKELTHLKRDHVIAAMDAQERDPIAAGERFSTLYKGQRFDPKMLLAQSYLFATGNRLDASGWADSSYAPFKAKLDELGFKTVKNPKAEGDTDLPVMVYEVKSPATVQANYQKLFSADRTRFFWNSDKFAKLKSGDPVFVVNAAAKEALYCLVDTLTIKADYNHDKDISTFSFNGETYEVAGKWNTFVALKIRATTLLNNAWRWKTLGSGEHTYLCGPDISPASARNNSERVNLLLEAFTSNTEHETEAEIQLQVCYQALQKILPEEEISKEEHEPAVWFVMQGKTFSEERGQKYLWAPEKDKRGATLAHWNAINQIKPGDIIVHNTLGGIKGLSKATSTASRCEDPFGENSEWGTIGKRVDVELLCLFEKPITVDYLRQNKAVLAKALTDVRGPFNVQGTGNQGYLFEFTWEALAILLKEVRQPLPELITRWLPEVDIEVLEQSEAIDEQPQPAPEKTTNIEPTEWLPKVQAAMAAKGFYYSLSELTNFYLALRTKPLVILAGISGTGKTQIVRQFAKAIGFGDDRHCVLIPVRPDWADNSDLVGYRNIQGEFEQQKLLKVLQDAIAHPDEPFFVILDEMNLARVEHYFSDFLSVLETREKDGNGVIRTSPVVTDTTVNRGVPVIIPQNLMLVGTVNMDETTHPFSRKVLDRANAIEMNDIQLNWSEVDFNEVEPVSGIYADAFVTPYINSIELNAEQKTELSPFIEQLIRINQILEPAGLHFGYRVRDEMVFYLCQHQSLGLAQANILASDDALDFQIMQKILPRIQGSSMAVFKVLVSLLKELSGLTIKDDMEFVVIEKLMRDHNQPQRYPRSCKKLLFMLQRFNDDGFTSFWL